MNAVSMRLFSWMLIGLYVVCAPARVFAQPEIAEQDRQELLLTAAQQAIEQRKPLIALRQLSLIGITNLQNSPAFPILRDAFSQLGNNLSQLESLQESKTAIEDDAVTVLIELAIAHDASLREVYLQVLIARAMSFAKVGDLAGLISTHQRFILVAPERSPLRDTFAFNVIEVAEGAARSGFATVLISELRQRGLLGVSDYFRFFMKGYFVGGIWGRNFVLSVVVFLVLLASYFVINLRQALQSKQTDFSKSGIFRNGPAISEILLSENDEYSRHLAVLGLDDSASEQDIKQAYRQLIKVLHPDGAQASQDPDLQKQFREVQFAYKRIKEMKEGWFHS